MKNMKHLLVILSLFAAINSYSQKAEAKTYKLTKAQISEAKTIKDLISDFPADCKVISYEFTGNIKGKPIIITGKPNPKEEISGEAWYLLKNHDASSTIYIDTKNECNGKAIAYMYSIKIRN